jgi:hypothetical protein
MFEEDQDIFKAGYFMRVYRPCGDYSLKWRIPREESQSWILEWITGGDDGNMSVETDYTGCVKIPMNVTDTGELFAQLDLFDAKMNDNVAQKWRNAIVKAKELSEFRVKRAINATYENLTKQWKTSAENKFEKHSPSITEYLCLHFKSKQMDRKSQIERETAKKVDEMMKKIEGTLIS